MTREADQQEASDGASGEERPAGREADRRKASNRVSGEERPASREAVVDAASALAVGSVVAAVVRWRDIPLSPRAVAVGAVGALALEGALLRHRDRVRALWERPSVRWGATIGGAGAAAVAAPRAPGRVLWALLGGVVSYLTLLAVVTARKTTNGSG
ncbi:hypothetical protein [Halostella pelagica]|uniref:hypothetical protein n=1 Tax=Halostella pelagica TaxID=2583824 RepID=UPI0010802DC7|nr:hypothetical protein [Halostella pelagica]